MTKKLKAVVIGWGILLASAPILLSQKSATADVSDSKTVGEIKSRIGELDQALRRLRSQGVQDPALADVEVYYHAAAWTMQQHAWHAPHALEWTLDAVNEGLRRAKLEQDGKMPWLRENGHAVVMGFRSHIDDTVQPYAVTRPADFGTDALKKFRIDVVLHGRDNDLTEVKFIHPHGRGKTEADVIRLDVFGRGNNGYRWAGETDVLEALEDFIALERVLGRGPLLDLQRVVLRGFSMGGAGTWSLGLHYPGQWCLLGPGAGFTTTHGYVKRLADHLPAYQEACLSIYDAADYSENVFDVPVVAYAGALDPQLQAARAVEDRIKPLGLGITLLIAPGLRHQFPRVWQEKASTAYLTYAGAGKGRKKYPKRVRFVTYTTKYPICDWVEIIGLGRHYDKAMVDASLTENGVTVTTINVTSLKLALPAGTTQPQSIGINGQAMTVRPSLSPDGTPLVYLEKSRVGDWQAVLPQKVITERVRRPQKSSGLQGPIDDAFARAFLCVRGTGKPWYDATARYVDADLERFQREWARYFHGTLPVKDDVSVTDRDIASRHLILFGDPSSNSLIAQVLDGLPIQWTQETIRFAGKTYGSADHVPVMVYPSPLNPDRLVVLNSGHTFHAPDFEGTNALLYPRLGDYAILKISDTTQDPLAAQVVTAGLFDEFWH